MNTTRMLFPGAMGPDGFISCFDDLIDENILKRRLILKGGPGVGKSTFMRRLYDLLRDDMHSSTLCFCSGDPDSLDAVVLPQAGLLILDGTAPHVIDPVLPGTRDSIINLGDCLDEAALRPRLQHIKACMANHAVISRRARAYLKAAYAIAQDNALLIASLIDSLCFGRMVSALVSSILDIDGKPSFNPRKRRVITDAVTPKGKLSLLQKGFYQRVIRLAGISGMDLTPVFRALSQAALSKGYDVEEHLDPLSPGSLCHLSFPALSAIITTNDSIPSEEVFDFAACIPHGMLLRHECTLEQGRAVISQHLQQAINSMQQAKQLHDELEAFYVPNMDFSKWQIHFDQTLESLRA